MPKCGYKTLGVVDEDPPKENYTKNTVAEPFLVSIRSAVRGGGASGSTCRYEGVC
jgi:hypothetical protein